MKQLPTAPSLVRTKDSADHLRIPRTLRRKIEKLEDTTGVPDDDKLFQIHNTPQHQWLKRLKPPKDYDVRRQMPKPPEKGAFENQAGAAIGREIWIRLLERSPRATHRKIAKALKKCEPAEPCGLSLCPVCLRRWRINYLWRVWEYIQTHCPDADLWAVTVVHPTGTINPTDLFTKGSFKKANGVLRANLIRAGLGHLRVIGANDLSYNTDKTGSWPPHWQLHHHLIFIGGTKSEIEDGLEKYYQVAGPIYKPTRVVPVINFWEQVSYTYKSTWFKRVSYIDNKGRRNAYEWPSLNKAQNLDLARFLATQTLSDRLFLRGVRRRGQKLVTE